MWRKTGKGYGEKQVDDMEKNRQRMLRKTGRGYGEKQVDDIEKNKQKI